MTIHSARLLPVVLSLCLLPQMASAFQEPPVNDVSPTSSAPDDMPENGEPEEEAGDNGTAAAQEETIQIMFRGETITIPLSALEGGQIDVGETGLRLGRKTDGTTAQENAEGETRPSTSGQETPPAESAESPPLDFEKLAPWILLGVFMLAVLFWFGWYLPAKRRRPLGEALKILNRDSRPEFPVAEEKLSASLLAGLKSRDIAEARFALAYVRIRLERHDEASVVLHDIEKDDEQKVDGPTAYLMLRVHLKLGNMERVERIYNEFQELLRPYEDVPLIASIAFLGLARMRWARREIDGAMHYFDQVRSLNVLADEIPSHIDDHEVVMGTMSLFEDNHDEAKKHFQAAVDAAEQSGKAPWAGRLGLLVCQWRQQDIPDVDDELLEILEGMAQDEPQESDDRIATQCTHCSKKYRVHPKYRNKKVKCRGCRKRFKVAVIEETPAEEEAESGNGAERDRLLNEDELLLRNVRLWHCVSLLFTWLRLKAEDGLPDDQREEFALRVKRVAAVDPDMSDAQLVESLINYYFARTPEEREAGHHQMEAAVAGGVTLPEILQLVEREKKWADLVRNRYTFLDQIVSGHLATTKHRPGEGKRLIRALGRFKRFRHLQDRFAEGADENAAPTVRDLQQRTDATRVRVTNYIDRLAQNVDDGTRLEIQGKLDSLETETRGLAENARSVEKLTTDVVIITAQEDLRDEEPLDDEEESDGADVQAADKRDDPDSE